MQSNYGRCVQIAVPSSSRRLTAFRHTRTVCCVALVCWTLQASMQAQAPPSLPLDPLPGQPKVATVTVGLGKVVSARRHKITFEKIGLQPQQAIDIALQYPVALAGHRVAVEPLDGGQVLTPAQNLAVAIDGTFTFRYQAGAKPGLYQVRVHYDAQAVALQFWVLDNAHLENSPPVITAN